MTGATRRTCPACARRYAGLVAVDCPVCHGLGVLSLGAAGLHNAPAQACARAVELYLEARARSTGAHRDVLEVAAHELRLAGLLHHPSDVAPAASPRPAVPPADAERIAVLLVAALGHGVSVEDRNRLRAPAVALPRTRPDVERRHIASANGSLSRLAIAADPIDMQGPDTLTLDRERTGLEQRATTLAAAVPAAAQRKARR